MPYNTINEMPDYTKKYPNTVRRMMMHVFNSTYNKVLKETKSIKQAEKRAFMSMHSVLKKNMEKFGPSHYGYDGYFMHLTDNFLGNLEG